MKYLLNLLLSGIAGAVLIGIAMGAGWVTATLFPDRELWLVCSVAFLLGNLWHSWWGELFKRLKTAGHE